MGSPLTRARRFDGTHSGDRENDERVGCAADVVRAGSRPAAGRSQPRASARTLVLLPRERNPLVRPRRTEPHVGLPATCDTCHRQGANLMKAVGVLPMRKRIAGSRAIAGKEHRDGDLERRKAGYRRNCKPSSATVG
jgi:hypothetical protein